MWGNSFSFPQESFARKYLGDDQGPQAAAMGKKLWGDFYFEPKTRYFPHRKKYYNSKIKMFGLSQAVHQEGRGEEAPAQLRRVHPGAALQDIRTGSSFPPKISNIFKNQI